MKTRFVSHIILFALPLVFACGGEEPSESVGPEIPERELRQPMLKMVTPTAIHAGDEMDIFGQGFEDGTVGQTRMTFEGVYLSSSGKTTPVKLDLVPKFKNQGVVSWSFGPNIPFSTEGETGVFRGVLKAVNEGLDGQQKRAPEALGVEIQVLPSILIRQMRPVSAGCPVGITATTGDTRFLFELEAVGLKSGSEHAPLKFVYTFLKEQFQFTGYTASASNQLGTDPEELFPQSGPVSIVDPVKNGNVSSLGTGAARDVYVLEGTASGGADTMPGTSDKLFGLTYLKTAPIPNATGSYSKDSFKATMSILAIDSSGQKAKRDISIEVWTPVSVEYDGETTMARIYDPVPVSACFGGGDVGREVTYTESTSETRERGFKIMSSVSGGVDIKVVRLNAEFGMEVEARVSSSSSKELRFSGVILPNMFGMFYRQTIQLEKTAELTGHGPCGETQGLGQVVVTDWVWAGDLGIGKSCPPPSKLPGGKVFTE
jgi:hypothetical protein